MTLTEAINAWKDENPFPLTVCDPTCHPITQGEYDAMASERGQWWLDRVNDEESSASWKLTVQQFTNKLSDLNADLVVVQNAINTNTNLTQAQIRIGFRDLLQSVIWLADRIKDGTIPTRRP